MSAQVGISVGLETNHDFYNRHITGVNLNGRWLQGFADGTPVRFNPQGGQVSITEGTDGPGLNMATNQGHVIEVDLREDSPDHEYIAQIRRQQYNGGTLVPMTFYTGTNRVFTCNVLISAPGDLSTGGPQQGSQTYTFVTRKSDLY